MMLKLFLAASLLVVLRSLGFSQEWELSKNENGIKVYTAAATSSKFKSIKVEAVLTGTIQKLVNVLKNVNENSGWVYHTKEAHLIKKLDENNILYYAETALPWPLSNRDMVIKMQFIEDTVNNALKVVATGIPEEVPTKKGIVRLQKFNGLWDVKSTGVNQVMINYVLTTEPGGSIPAGISNMFISKGPLETFNNLAKLLKK